MAGSNPGVGIMSAKVVEHEPGSLRTGWASWSASWPWRVAGDARAGRAGPPRRGHGGRGGRPRRTPTEFRSPRQSIASSAILDPETTRGTRTACFAGCPSFRSGTRRISTRLPTRSCWGNGRRRWASSSTSRSPRSVLHNCHGTAGAGRSGSTDSIGDENGVRLRGLSRAYKEWVNSHQFADDPNWRAKILGAEGEAFRDDRPRGTR